MTKRNSKNLKSIAVHGVDAVTEALAAQGIVADAAPQNALGWTEAPGETDQPKAPKVKLPPTIRIVDVLKSASPAYVQIESKPTIWFHRDSLTEIEMTEVGQKVEFTMSRRLAKRKGVAA